MALTLEITPKELERQAALAFQGKTFKVFLAYDPANTLTKASTTAQWTTKELASTAGYAAVTGTIGTGTWNESLTQYELPSIAAQFTATGAGYVYDTIVVVIDNQAYPHSVTSLSAEQGLFAGQARSFTIKLIQDD